MKELMEMLKKKKKNKEMSKGMDTKMEMLEQLKELAAKMMGEDLGSLKKVTVASDDEEGLKAGLKKAKELLGSEDGEDEEEDEYC